MTNTDTIGMNHIELSDVQRKRIAEKKATCPFIASAVKSRELKVFNSADRPLAAIADIVALGDKGDSDLGRIVLNIFAHGNHSKMPDASGAFIPPTPAGMMSLDLAGSKGAHPGHSGIMLDKPKQLDGGAFNKREFKRLESFAKDEQLSTAEVGKFIADNLKRDPDSEVGLSREFADDFVELLRAIGDLAKPNGHDGQTASDKTKVLEKFTDIAGRNNLVGSAGEFALLFAFFANRPGSDTQDGMVIPVKDVRQMMQDHRFPSDWEKWPKKTTDWIKATNLIVMAAGTALGIDEIKERAEEITERVEEITKSVTKILEDFGHGIIEKFRT